MYFGKVPIRCFERLHCGRACSHAAVTLVSRVRRDGRTIIPSGHAAGPWTTTVEVATMSNLLKFSTIIACTLGCAAQYSYAAPVVTGTSGTLGQGETISILGSGF